MEVALIISLVVAILLMIAFMIPMIVFVVKYSKMKKECQPYFENKEDVDKFIDNKPKYVEALMKSADLSTCVASLDTCKQEKATCEQSKVECASKMTACDIEKKDCEGKRDQNMQSLSECTTAKEAVTTEKATCQASLATCQRPAPVPAPAPTGRVYKSLPRTDYFGQGDIKAMSGNLDACKSECDKVTGCKGFVTDGMQCWLKSAAVRTPSYKSNGTYYYAGDAPSAAAVGNVATWGACTNSQECAGADSFCRVGDKRCLSDSECAYANSVDKTNRDCTRMPK